MADEERLRELGQHEEEYEEGQEAEEYEEEQEQEGEAQEQATEEVEQVEEVEEEPEEEKVDIRDKRELGKLAVWSVSTAKPGNGVELLRDGNLETFWQSDGAQPHLINVQFQRKVRLQLVGMYLDSKLDESYTPSKISFRAGNSTQDLREIKLVEMKEPNGWVYVNLQNNEKNCVRAFLLQIAVLTNQQNGRDTHLRQITVYGPRQTTARAMGLPSEFSSVEFSMYSCIR